MLIVGDTTSGVFSGTIDKPLPNGWVIDVPNEHLIAPDGTSYEAIGIAPDVLVPYFPEAVKATGVDPGLEKAMHLLGSPRFDELAVAAKRAPGIGHRSACVGRG